MNGIHDFTPRAQQTLAFAGREADRLNHNYVGTEHLLLGLLQAGDGLALTVLTNMGVNLETARKEVEHQIGSGPETKMTGNLPYTPRVKKVLALAQKEAHQLNHNYVGTEHILLGLLREGEGSAARVLQAMGASVDKCRDEILKALDPNYQPPVEAAPSERGGEKWVSVRLFDRRLGRLGERTHLGSLVSLTKEVLEIEGPDGTKQSIPLTPDSAVLSIDFHPPLGGSAV